MFAFDQYLVAVAVAVAAAYTLMWLLDRLAERVTEKAFIGIVITGCVTVIAFMFAG